MTREEFLGTPVIMPFSLQPIWPFDLPVAAEKFMDKFTAKYSARRSAVFENGVFIAGFVPGTALVSSSVWVDPKYRRLGIAAELIYQTVRRYKITTPARHRSAEGQAVYVKVWERLQKEKIFS